METKSDKDILFYDGACQLCSAEVARLKCLANDELSFQDVHLLQEKEIANNNLPSREQLLQNLHLLRKDHSMVVGLNANIAAWEYTNRGWLLAFLKAPGVNALATVVYKIWAKFRYKKMYK